MKDHELANLEVSISEVLLPNASFYRESPNDESLYYIDIATVGALAYEIMQFAANVFGATIPLVAGGRWLYKKYFSNESPTDSYSPDNSENLLSAPIDKDNVKEKLDNLRHHGRDPEIRENLTQDIEKILNFHGWPAVEASNDANQIVKSLIDDSHVQPK